MTANDPITLTLPSPVTRSVTWEQVRAYLRAEGWAPTASPDADGDQWWRGPSGTCFTASNDHAGEMAHSIERLARIASVSPGEMLVRIAGQTESTTPHTGYSLAEAVEVLGIWKRRAIAAADALGIGQGEPWDFAEATEKVRRRAAADMRERCAAYLEGLDVAHVERFAILDAAAGVRALPLVAPAPLCVPGCVRREAEGAGHPGACREPAVPANDGGKAGAK